MAKKTRENNEIKDLRGRLHQTQNHADDLSHQQADLKEELATALQNGGELRESEGIFEQFAPSSGTRWNRSALAASPEEIRHISDVRGRMQQTKDQSTDVARQEDQLQNELDVAVQAELETHQSDIETERELGGES